jgi:hypothetical protein
LEEHLNPKGGRKHAIQPITLNQIAFGHFLSQLAIPKMMSGLGTSVKKFPN